MKMMNDRWREATGITVVLLALYSQPAFPSYSSKICDELEQRAQSGDVDAQVGLAHCFYTGAGRDVDYGAAESLLNAAIEGGSGKARIALASLILFKTRDDSRYAQAIDYLADGAAENDAYAMFSLAVALRNGLGVPIDTAQSDGLFLRAAEADHLLSIFVVFGEHVLRGPSNDDSDDLLFWRRKLCAQVSVQRQGPINRFIQRIAEDKLVLEFIFTKDEMGKIVESL